MSRMDGGEVPSQRHQDELFDTPAKGVGRRELTRHFALTERTSTIQKNTGIFRKGSTHERSYRRGTVARSVSDGMILESM